MEDPRITEGPYDDRDSNSSYAALIAQRDAALADTAALREHLQPINDNGQMRCQVCHHWWYVGDPERHEEGCILRAPHPGQSRLDGLVDEIYRELPTEGIYDSDEIVRRVRSIITRERKARQADGSVR